MSGLADFVQEFKEEDPNRKKSNRPPTKEERKQQYKEEKLRLELERISQRMEACSSFLNHLGDPEKNSKATQDPFKTLFVARLVEVRF